MGPGLRVGSPETSSAHIKHPAQDLHLSDVDAGVPAVSDLGKATPCALTPPPPRIPDRAQPPSREKIAKTRRL